MRKSQAGLDILVNYGWAIILVLIAIAALTFYSGLIDFKQDKCIMGGGFMCKQFEVSKDRVYVQINNPGKAITNVRGELDCGNEFQDTAEAGSADTGQDFELLFDGYPGDKADCGLVVVYKTEKAGYDKRAEGEIYWGKVRSRAVPGPACQNNDQLDNGESDTQSGLAPGWGGPWPSDCGSPESNCPGCEDNRRCLANDDCASNCCDIFTSTCATEGSSPIFSKAVVICQGAPDAACYNDVLDPGESDTITGLPPGWGGPWGTDCGSPESGCMQCEDYRRCEHSTQCLHSCCDENQMVCVDPSGGSPYMVKPEIVCVP